MSVRTTKFQMLLLLGAIGLLLADGAGVAMAATQHDAPVIPTSVNELKFNEDYQRTLDAGRGKTFAKVGDSNTAFPQNLTALGCRANLNLSSPALQTTANFYKETFLPDTQFYCPWLPNSFTRYSAATRGGGPSSLPLSESQHLPSAGVWFLRDPMCSSDSETALACEIRLTNGRYTLIGGGSNDFNPAWKLKLSDAKQRFLDLIEEARDHSSIPILQTVPAITSSRGPQCLTAKTAAFNAEMEGKVEAMNQAILDAGEEQGVPVINLWAGLKDLPNKGLQPDGIHLSYEQGSDTADTINKAGDLSPAKIGAYGVNARNYYVLEMLKLLADQLISNPPPAAANYDAIGTNAVTSNSINVAAQISGTPPSGASSVMTGATGPGGATPAPKAFTAIGGGSVNNVPFNNLSPATTYYFRGITTYGTSPNEKKIASSEISATTKGAPDTSFVPPKPPPPGEPPPEDEKRTFNFTSNVRGPSATFECSVDGGAYAPCAPPVTFPSSGSTIIAPATTPYPNLRSGWHAFQVRALNYGVADPSPAGTLFEIPKPNVTITGTPADGATTTSRNATLTSSSSDPTGYGGIEYTLKRNGEIYQISPGVPASGFGLTTMSFSDLPDGDYEFTTNWKNSANETDPTPPVHKWTVENDPRITSGPAQGSTTADDDPVFSFSSIETNATFECGITTGFGNPVNWEPCTSPKSYSNLGEGFWSFQVRVTNSNCTTNSAEDHRIWVIDY